MAAVLGARQKVGDVFHYSLTCPVPKQSYTSGTRQVVFRTLKPCILLCPFFSRAITPLHVPHLSIIFSPDTYPHVRTVSWRL